MRLETNPKWPEWLKRDPKSGIWRVVQYRADKNPPRLDRSTGEAISIERAKSLGKTIYEEWLGHKLDGSRLRPLFSTLCDEVIEQMESAREALELRAAGLFMGSDGYTRKRKLVAGRYVFPSRGNADMPTHQNKSAWTRAKRSAGILNRCRFHDLRHTFLTDCANLLRVGTPGISVVHVCAYAGLSIRTFERVYLQLDHNDTAAVSNLVTVKLRYSEKQQDLTNGDHK